MKIWESDLHEYRTSLLTSLNNCIVNQQLRSRSLTLPYLSVSDSRTFLDNLHHQKAVLWRRFESPPLNSRSMLPATISTSSLPFITLSSTADAEQYHMMVDLLRRRCYPRHLEITKLIKRCLRNMQGAKSVLIYGLSWQHPGNDPLSFRKITNEGLEPYDGLTHPIGILSPVDLPVGVRGGEFNVAFSETGKRINWSLEFPIVVDRKHHLMIKVQAHYNHHHDGGVKSAAVECDDHDDLIITASLNCGGADDDDVLQMNAVQLPSFSPPSSSQVNWEVSFCFSSADHPLIVTVGSQQFKKGVHQAMNFCRCGPLTRDAILANNFLIGALELQPCGSMALSKLSWSPLYPLCHLRDVPSKSIPLTLSTFHFTDEHLVDKDDTQLWHNESILRSLDALYRSACCPTTSTKSGMGIEFESPYNLATSLKRILPTKQLEELNTVQLIVSTLQMNLASLTSSKARLGRMLRSSCYRADLAKDLEVCTALEFMALLNECIHFVGDHLSFIYTQVSTVVDESESDLEDLMSRVERELIILDPLLSPYLQAKHLSFQKLSELFSQTANESLNLLEHIERSSSHQPRKKRCSSAEEVLEIEERMERPSTVNRPLDAHWSDLKLWCMQKDEELRTLRTLLAGELVKKMMAESELMEESERQVYEAMVKIF
eukprot:GHVH01004835.1.p1 GENE.GHVH01004835.1~~GHVH01004835.1.p1  ORF type:complete len:660 (+),score=110.51 GHVH01004835.1:1119-3098(+)